MSKVNFYKVSSRLSHPEYGLHHSHEFIGCDLARPTSELEAIAVLLESVPSIGTCIVLDCVLYVKSDYKTPYALQERALHRILAIARKVLDEGMAAMPEEMSKPTPRPEPCHEVYCSRASAYVRKDGERHTSVKYAMPEGFYGPGMLVMKHDEHLAGYFLISNSYDRSQRSLAKPLLAMFAPQAGVTSAGRDGYASVRLDTMVDGIEDIGAACLRIAAGMLAAMKMRVRKLPYEGLPSAFLDEDNDARDVLLAEMAGGATLQRSNNEDDGDAESRFVYALQDGTEVAPHVVRRLREAGYVIPEDGAWGHSSTLVAIPGLTPEQLQPRKKTVSFDMFQNACRFRRHPDDGEEECVSPDRGGCNSYCESESCPLLDRVHENEQGGWASDRTIDDDPAFNYHVLDERPDPLMQARHPNTTRSHAWKVAGEDRVVGIVNQVLSAHYTYGIPMLVETIHEVAVDEAVAKGWLTVDSRNALGSVTRVTPMLLSSIEQQKAEQSARQQDKANA